MNIMTRVGQRFATLASVATLLAFAACNSDSPVGATPQLPQNPVVPPQYRGAAFIMDVSPLKKTIKITAPTTTIGKSRVSESGSLLVGDGPDLSLLGGDVIDLTATNYVAGAVGASVPGKVLVTFDLTVNNKLAGIQLVTPTFPTPPSGVTGLQLFPFEISVTTTAGGVTTVGNEVIVTSPRFGAVIPSNDWSGAPHNFFNDIGCPATANDCFRYEPFGTIAPLGASTAQTVGFLIDPTVGDFRVKMIVAADLNATTTPTPGTISGSVTSPQLGALNNVSVSVSGGFSGTSNATGAYSIANVATGSRTVSISNLPSGCTAPASQNVTVASGGTNTVNFTVTCSVPTGSISGTVTSSLGGGLAGVQVTVTPTGAGALAAVATSASGTYTVASVPTVPATGAITLANLPANCTNPGPTAYSGMTTGGLTTNILVTCTAAAVTYPFSAVWGPITNTGPTGRQVQLTFSIDMGAAPGRLDVDGANADPLAGISYAVSYNGTILSYASRTLLSPGGELDLGVVNQTGGGTAGAQANVAIGSTSGAVLTGNNQIIRLTFNIATGAAGTIVPTVNVTEALATTSLINVTSSVAVQALPSLIVP